MFNKHYILKNITLFAALLVITLCLTPPGFGLSTYKVPANDIVYRTTDEHALFMRFDVAPVEGTLRQQFFDRQTKTRRFHFKFDEAYPVDGPRTLYIPSGGGPFRPVINGAYIGVGEAHSFSAPAFGSHWKSIDIPRHFFLPGQNRIDIFMKQDLTRSGIRQVYFGPSDRIRKAVSRQKSWMNVIPRVILLGYGGSVLLCVFGMFLAGRKTDFLAIGFLSLFMLIPGLLSLMGDTYVVSKYSPLILFIFPFVVIFVIILTYSVRTDRVRAIGGSYLALILFSLTGPLFAIVLMFTPVFIDQQFFVATLALLGVLPLAIVSSGIDLVSALGSRKSRIQELTLKVSMQSEELDEKTKLIVAEMRQRALMEERQRFTRDIHDGIGGKLLSLLLQVRTGDLNRKIIAEEIQEGIHDLRLVVDSIDHIGEDLDVIFETFKARALPQMKASKITLNWRQPEKIIGAIESTGGGSLHLYRLMQEALTNIVRHSKASEVDFIVSQPATLKQLDVIIRDNGVGILDNAIDGPGSGIKNMEVRAKALGAKLTIETFSNGAGTQLSLSIPLDRTDM